MQTIPSRKDKCLCFISNGTFSWPFESLRIVTNQWGREQNHFSVEQKSNNQSSILYQQLIRPKVSFYFLRWETFTLSPTKEEPLEPFCAPIYEKFCSSQICCHFCFVGLLLVHFILFYASVSYVSPDATGQCKRQRAELVAFSPGTSNDPEMLKNIRGQVGNTLSLITCFGDFKRRASFPA